MIGRLTGKVIDRQPPMLLLDVGGVGYELQAPLSTFTHLDKADETVVLHTHLIVRDDAHLLFAFATLQERDMFRGLLKINGVGAKMALGILSGMTAEELCQCVNNGDIHSLTRLPGIGKKTAERLIVEMKDRIGKLLGDLPAASGQPASTGSRAREPLAEAVEALIALGYKPADASRMVQAVNSDGLRSDEIIRLALKSKS
ncbi:MAG: Holliday junction branch migration protein RuvA [gamma proteobacterium symbiont of Bathyaustriella thionipta]|nr:Holliday junction branch migration protein RuvA [gamma proteobacterium symbiont of Bathyaustriella thionipta]